MVFAMTASVQRTHVSPEADHPNSSGTPRRHRFTVDEYYRMARAGVFGEDDRMELIEGGLVDMSPIGPEHAGATSFLNHALLERLRDKALVRVQLPLRIDETSEPEPDLVLVRPREDYYRSDHPRPDDVLLLIEVSETSRDYDRRVKLPLYARAGIPEVWLADLVENAVEVHRRPRDGRYEELRTYRSGESLRCEALPELEIPVAGILG